MLLMRLSVRSSSRKLKVGPSISRIPCVGVGVGVGGCGVCVGG